MSVTCGTDAAIRWCSCTVAARPAAPGTIPPGASRPAACGRSPSTSGDTATATGCRAAITPSPIIPRMRPLWSVRWRSGFTPRHRPSARRWAGCRFSARKAASARFWTHWFSSTSRRVWIRTASHGSRVSWASGWRTVSRRLKRRPTPSPAIFRIASARARSKDCARI